MKYTLEQLKNAVHNSTSYSGVLRYLNKSITGSSHRNIKKAISRNGIDTSHFLPRKSRGGYATKVHWSKILINDDSLIARRSGARLTKALIESGRSYECGECGITNWKGHKLVLEVDHKDGNWKNNLSNNLRFLCPNCHSLTPNFYHCKKIHICNCGKTKCKTSYVCNDCVQNLRRSEDPPDYIVRSQRIQWPTKECLEKSVWEKPTSQIAKELGVSDTAIKKWCRKYNISKPPRGYWQKQRVAA